MENQGVKIIRECEVLRARKAYNEAIALVEENIDSIDPAYKSRAWLEAFQLAREKGDPEQARRYALLADQVAEQRGGGKLLTDTPHDAEGWDIISASANLRSQGMYDEAIELIERNIGSIHKDYHVHAWYEAFYAAQAKGDTEQAKRFVVSIASADPGALTRSEEITR